VKPWPASLLAAATLLAACATLSPPPLEQRTSQGPTARQFWTLRSVMANGRQPSLDERRHFEDQLEIRISQYLAQHPEDANSLQVSSFRFDKRAVVGMSKEQILILLGAPDATTTDQAAMEKLARRYWPQMKGNVTEAWTYPLGWSFFFAGQRVVDITQYLERD
jgi:hypothetical protein